MGRWVPRSIQNPLILIELKLIVAPVVKTGGACARGWVWLLASRFRDNRNPVSDVSEEEDSYEN
jgi:hypothetical protein